jgi:hypothetical protein
MQHTHQKQAYRILLTPHPCLLCSRRALQEAGYDMGPQPEDKDALAG